MDQSLLLSLPDDELLAVLVHLWPEDLLRCRLVCRRLRDLCLYRDLWRDAMVDYDDDSNLLHAVFSVAPCLGNVAMAGESIANLSYCVAGTTCVVARLSLEIDSECEAALATAVIHKLGALGGVRTVVLKIDFCPDECRLVMMALLKAAYVINDLQELDIINRTAKPLPDIMCELYEVTPSLRRLHYMAPAADPFLLLLLKTHPVTLQRVALVQFADVPAPLLAKIPGLRSLNCHPCEGLSLLASLPHLESFSCGIGLLKPESFPAGALYFFTEALHLRNVIVGDTPDTNHEALLRSLVKSRSSGLFETLKLPASSELLDLCIVPALSKFTSLQSLEVICEPSDIFFRAISPASVPSLTSLTVGRPKETCLHAWLHGPALQDVLARNPSLHLYGYRSFEGVRSDCTCQWCSWGCHRLLRESPDHTAAGASAHIRGAGCPWDCVQVACDHPLSSTM